VNLPDYPETTPSSFQGLGTLPKHWEVIRGRFVMDVNRPAPRLRLLKPEDEVSFVPMDAVGEHGGINLDQTRALADVSSGYTEFQDGDVVVAKITPCFENGKAALAQGLMNGAAYGTTELHVLRAGPTLERRFLFYVAISDRFRKLGESEMYGAGGQKRVPPEFNKDFPMPLPSLPEQQQIAAFLDWKTGQIDALIARKQELLERLKEKRIAVITQAVTRGLNPAAPLRDSGIPWLGQVPQHWRLLPIKYLLKAILDTEHKTAPYFDDGEYLVARTPNIRDGKLTLDGAKYTDVDGYREWTARGIPKPGDILFTREAPAGEACIVPDAPRLCIGQRVVLFRTDPQCLDSRFAIYSIYGGAARIFIEMQSLGSTVTHFNMSEIAMIPMLAPPVDEQSAIVGYLDDRVGKIDAMTRRMESAIARLTEYRTAVITAATMGKIDVRNVKMPEPVA
jgi:type I restriction enzyme, S subunit